MNLKHMKIYPAGETVDVVIIGTGAGGAPLAAQLSQAGLSVIALEAGPNFDAKKFTSDEGEAAEIYWTEERLSGGETPTAFGGNNSGTGVGGSTLHWGAFVPRPDARDLSAGDHSDLSQDWPLTPEELTPYLKHVEDFVGVSGTASYPWDEARSYPFPPVARNAPADAMERGCKTLGITTADAPAALISRDKKQPFHGMRHACANCGACHQGCRNGAKVSMDVTYLPMAVAHGAEIRPDARVIDIETSESGKVSAVVYVKDGVTTKQPCRQLVIAAGGIETPRLLLHCGLANSSGQVGRNFMAHVATQVWGTFQEEMRMNRGYPSSLISEDMMRPKDADFQGGYLLQSIGVMPVTLATTLVRGGGFWGQRLVELLDNYTKLAGLGINGDCLPYDHNLLTLSEEVDAFGIPKARVDFSYGENEKKMHRHAVDIMTAIWDAAGATDIFALDRSAHTIGTCRMSVDAQGGVVNSVGQSHDIANLWICDNSVFPSALAANPALTIMALSLRTADAMLRST